MIRFAVLAKDCLGAHEIELRRVLSDQVGLDLGNPHGFAVLNLAEVDQLMAALYALRTIISVTEALERDNFG